VNRRELASKIWPRFSKRVESLNWNARYWQWLRRHKAPHYSSRYALHLAVFEGYVEGDIDLLEFGVWEGKSLTDFSQLTESDGSTLYGFDSFEGLPHGAGDWKAGQFGVDTMPKFEDPRVTLIKGWFQDTLPDFIEHHLAVWGSPQTDRQLVVHIDCDLHSSVMFVLSTLDRLLEPGSIIFFDELSVAEEEFRALIDWSDAFMRNYRVLGTFNKLGRIEGAALMIEHADLDPRKRESLG